MTEISFNRLKEAIPKRPIDWNESEFHLSLDFFKLNEFKYKLRIEPKKYIIIYLNILGTYYLDGNKFMLLKDNDEIWKEWHLPKELETKLKLCTIIKIFLFFYMQK